MTVPESKKGYFNANRDGLPVCPKAEFIYQHCSYRSPGNENSLTPKVFKDSEEALGYNV